MHKQRDSLIGAKAGREVLAWYDRHARSLPWRIAPSARLAGALPDPYHVWLSEVMLQQTRVATVIPYFTSFLRKWPDLRSLAAAKEDAILTAWAGLGYYSRARNLKRCASAIVDEHDGRMPESREELRRLPGIGSYTAAAIAAIAFDEPVAVIDGNVERVIARIGGLRCPKSRLKTSVGPIIERMIPRERPGDFAQAMMDLGATVCTPKGPACSSCPLQRTCDAGRLGNPQEFPVAAVKPDKPLRRGAAFVACTGNQEILLRKRPRAGLLAGMSEVPTTGWSARSDGDTGRSGAPIAAAWRRKGRVNHSFTHFDLELTVWRAELDAPASAQGEWVPIAELEHHALPSLMKKAIAVAIPHAFGASGRR